LIEKAADDHENIILLIELKKS